MEHRNRNERIRIYVTSEEKEQMEKKMKEAGYSNFSAYARKMLLNGQINKVNLLQLKPLIQELGNLNRNLHQIVYRAAMINDLHEEDYRDIVKIWDQAWSVIKRKLTRIIKTGGEALIPGESEDENGNYEDQGD